MQKHEAFYLANAVFCNYSEIDDFVSAQKPTSENEYKRLSNFSLLEIHYDLFKIFKYFCTIEKTILDK
jgi:hypothetical protein